MTDFFKKNLQKIVTEKRSISPDSKFTILRSGLKNYYSTFQVFNKKIKLHYFEGQGFEDLSVMIDHEYILASYTSILLLHIFFEHYLNAVLLEVHPFLLYNKLNTEKDVISLISQKWENIPAAGKNTIDYSLQLGRICELIAKDKDIPNELKVPSKYHFILKHKDGLKILADQRNEIIHSGDKILPTYAYELLMVNYVLPLVRQVLLVEKEIPYISRRTYCDIDIIELLSKIKLPEKHLTSLKKVNENLRKINHYKELGRASFENPLGMFASNHSDESKENIEKHHNRKLRESAIKDAEMSTLMETPHKIHICPCCGTNSLRTFGIIEDYASKSKFVLMAKCFLCTYSVNMSIGEPNEFGIECDTLFEELS